MKKLMTACAACVLAGMVSAQVESVNIVGYQMLPLNEGAFTHISPTFITVGGAAQITLADISGDMQEMDSVQFMDAGFATDKQYFYLIEGSASPDITGWYEDDFETFAGNVVITAGSSVLYSSQGSTQVTFAGEVNDSAVEVASVVGGFVSIGNPFPVGTMLSDITFTGISEMCSVQIMNEIAATTAEYFWLEEGSASPDVTGWYADDFETPAGDTVIGAGQGFLFSEQGAGTTISFTSPL